ncbi:MAG: PKD domain-containing protein, partial [Thermoplasmatota archaeon]
ATAHNTSSVSLVWDFDYWTNDEWMEKMNTKNATVSVVVSDGEFEIGPFQKVVSISLKEEEIYNAPPVISGITASADEIYENGFVILAVDVMDPDGDALTIYWTHGNEQGFNMSGASVNISGLTPGTYQFNLTVLDGKHKVTDSITVKVLELPPEKKDGSSSFGLILVIVIAIVVVILIIIAALWFLVFSKKKKKDELEVEPQEMPEETFEGPPTGSDEVTIGDLTVEGEAPPEEPGMEIPQQQEPPAAPPQPPAPQPQQAPAQPSEQRAPAVPTPPQVAPPQPQAPPVQPPPPQAPPVTPPQPQPPVPES